MTISDYADLQDAIYKWLLRENSDLVVTTAQVKRFISLCEAELNRELKIRSLQDSSDLVTVEDQDFITLPSGFKRMISFGFVGQPQNIEFVGTLNEMRTRYGKDKARPEAFLIAGNRIKFNCPADAAHDMSIDYYKKITALSDANTTNDILTDYPDAYLYGALKQAQLQIGNEKKLIAYGTSFTGIVERIINEDQYSKLPTGARIQPRRVI